MGIVVLGAVFVDVKGYPNKTYIPKGRNAGRVEQTFGGVARNVAEDIANMELRPTFVSIVDDDGVGDSVINQLNKHKVNTDYIRKVKDGNGTWLAIFDESGDVQASISKRPDLMPILDILNEKGDEIFSQADSIAVEVDMDTDIVRKIFELAEKHGKDVYALVSNMSIAVKRRDLIQKTSCFVCNLQEAGIFFSDDLEPLLPEQLVDVLSAYVKAANINAMVVTMGGDGACYADKYGNKGIVPANKVEVVDTTGAGDSFFAGVTAGLTYGKTLEEACKIGTRIASSVIATTEAVCPRFRPEELGFESKD